MRHNPIKSCVLLPRCTQTVREKRAVPVRVCTSIAVQSRDFIAVLHAYAERAVKPPSTRSSTPFM